MGVDTDFAYRDCIYGNPFYNCGIPIFAITHHCAALGIGVARPIDAFRPYHRRV